jgi:hypothetical protein
VALCVICVFASCVFLQYQYQRIENHLQFKYIRIQFNSYLFTYKCNSSKANYKVSTTEKINKQTNKDTEQSN